MEPAAFQFALAPTPAQLQSILRHFGARRFAHNWAVELLRRERDAYRSTGVGGESPSLGRLRKRWNVEKHLFCNGTLEVGCGDSNHHRPARHHRPWGYAPAAASSAVGTGGTFSSCTVPWAPLLSAEEVEVYELYHVALADGLISLTKEVVVYGRYDLVLLDHAVVVGVVPVNERVPRPGCADE